VLFYGITPANKDFTKVSPFPSFYPIVFGSGRGSVIKIASIMGQP
jgi:hypothetical protein